MQISPREIPLIEAALAIVEDEGLTAVTLQKIAKGAKVSFGKAQRYLGGEADWIEKAVLFVGTQAQSYIGDYLVSKNGNPIHDYIQGTFKWSMKHPTHAAFWCYLYHLCMLSNERSSRYISFLEVAQNRIESLLYEAIGRGHYNKVKSGQKLAQAVHNQLVGAIISANAFKAQRPQKGSIRSTIHAVDAIINHCD